MKCAVRDNLVRHRHLSTSIVFAVEQSGDDFELGNRIREAREKTGLSQQAMAAKLDEMGLPDASFGSYRRYETGEKSPSAAVVRGIASIADVRVQELLGEEVIDGPTFPEDAPPDGLQILGHIEAELMRQEEEGAEGGPQKAFEIVEQRVQRLRGEGRIDDAGYAYWRALRRGAVLAGGYEPEDRDPEDPAVNDSAQRDIA